MVKLRGQTPSPKFPALRGRVVIQHRGGQVIASKWPRRRGKPKSAKTLEQNEWFRQANILARYADWKSQWQAIRLSKNSGWYPRDILMSLMAGRFIELIVIDGEEYYSVALRDDVSKDLDIVTGKAPWVIMVRGSDLWEPLANPTIKSVLQCDGPNQLPHWEPGGGGGGGFTNIEKLTWDSGNNQYNWTFPSDVDRIMVTMQGRLVDGGARPRVQMSDDSGASWLTSSSGYKDGLDGSDNAMSVINEDAGPNRPFIANFDMMRDTDNGGFAIAGKAYSVQSGGGPIVFDPKGCGNSYISTQVDAFRIFDNIGNPDSLGPLSTWVYTYAQQG